MNTCWGLYVARSSKVLHCVGKSPVIFSDILSFVFLQIFMKPFLVVSHNFNTNLVGITYTFECRFLIV
jgi:hypothetical protein